MNLFPWTVFLPEDIENGLIQRFWPATIWRGGAFHFLPVFSKKKILWKLWLWFSKMFHQRDFSDWIWRISKFPFWRQILDIYRQPVLKRKWVSSSIWLDPQKGQFLLFLVVWLYLPSSIISLWLLIRSSFRSSPSSESESYYHRPLQYKSNDIKKYCLTILHLKM